MKKIIFRMPSLVKIFLGLAFGLWIITLLPGCARLHRPSLAIDSPRSRLSLDAGWRFKLGDPDEILTNSALTNVACYPEIPDLAKLTSNEIAGVTSEGRLETLRPDPRATRLGENVSAVQNYFDDTSWMKVSLPHDWVVALPFDSSADAFHGFKPVGYDKFKTNNIGWYRRTFTLPKNLSGKALSLEFDGVYRNCLVWLNGHILGRNVGGYGSFYFDVTGSANPGGTNVLVVRVDASRFEGWFYEGAGIYRHVWLTATDPVHVAEWGTFVTTTSLIGSNATLLLQTEITNQSGVAADARVTSTIYDSQSNSVASVNSLISLPPRQALTTTQTIKLTANVWSLQSPYLYHLATKITRGQATADIYNTPFGVRTVSIDATNGVSLNGQRVEIQGMCNHQDMAGVGSALPDRLQYFRIERLKQMGVNACRTSHNEPTAELLDACDELGLLVLDENRRPGTNAEPLLELERQVRRDRNHPSVFMWSLANEEPLQGTAEGASIIKVMQDRVHSLDSTRLCTAALNSWGPGFSSVLDVNGFNYQLYALDPYHSAHPAEPVIGSETASLVSDRGLYTNDVPNGFVWGYDVENPKVDWGESAQAWWSFYARRPWSSGGFAWTGFDYRGEPSPYAWPCVNSHFGTLDMCGFPKDNFYYYQANWTLKPVLHVFPHWNWSRIGQPINVWVFGNCPVVELLTNGVSLGRQAADVRGHVEWKNVAYAPGTLQAIGYDHGEAVLTNTVTTTGSPSAIALWPDRTAILNDGCDVSVVTVAVVDAAGRIVPTATNQIAFTVSDGLILGVGNGNPSSHEADKASQRSVFGGLAQVIIQSTHRAGPILLTATSAGLVPTNVTLRQVKALPPPAAPANLVAKAGNARVMLSWDIVPGAKSYDVWRATDSGGPYMPVIQRIAAADLGFVDETTGNFKTFYYVVTANGRGAGEKSAEAWATPSPWVTGLKADATNGQIALRWQAISGSRYNLKRSTQTGGPYETLVAAWTNSFYLDGQVATSQPYFYVVTLTDGNNESMPSAEASAEIRGARPGSFSSTDIGNVGFRGSEGYCDGRFVISGSGADVWGSEDAFHFVYVHLPANTNCDFSARIMSMQNTSPNAKAALMIRESLAPDSAQAMVDGEPDGGREFIWRPGKGTMAASSFTNGTASGWVRLTRTNNLFSAYLSDDGQTWSQLGTNINIPMHAGTYAGLAVCAHDNSTLNCSIVDELGGDFLNASSNQTLPDTGGLEAEPKMIVAQSADSFNAGTPEAKNIWDNITAMINARDYKSAASLLEQLASQDGLSAEQRVAAGRLSAALQKQNR